MEAEHQCTVVRYSVIDRLWHCEDCWEAYRLVPGQGHVPAQRDGAVGQEEDS